MKMRLSIHLILDWDGTLTRKDTLSLVGQIAYHANPSKSLPPWSDFVTGYINDYTDHTSKYKPAVLGRKSLDQERQWLASLAPIEHKSVERVEASGIFKGVKASHVDHVAKSAVQTGEVQLRSSWDTLLRGFLCHPSNKLSILSVNWSTRFIRQSLLAAAAETTCAETQSLTPHIESMVINANEITGLDTPSGSDGTLSKDTVSGIRTSADKLSQVVKKKEHAVVYIGDSATDLEALLAADVGICIRDEVMGSSQRELADTLERIGVKVRDISEGVLLQGTNKILYWTDGFEKVVEALEKI
ncbi:hypothetical protein D6D19_05915 [Aureobasidium pullulans]|uniref:HAD-like protein n=1 Tax=Aureobasidium pullulans TaxID=5580 RepID=A0A4S9A2J4_AURPU|nr:hypothetical protein D6D19_05915 [Aureobasidium pullulans]